MLSAESLKKFKEIYREVFDENLSDAELVEKTQSIINVFQVMLKSYGRK